MSLVCRLKDGSSLDFQTPLGDENQKQNVNARISNFSSSNILNGNCKECEEDLRQHKFLTSTSNPLDHIQKIANCLRNQDKDGLQRLSFEIPHFFPDLKLLTNLSEITLPQDIHRINQISHPDIKDIVLANLINRDQIPLKSLKLTKEQIIRLGPLLTYLDCTGCFDDGFEKDEVYFFLESSSHQVKTLIVDNMVTLLPVILPECEKLDCRYVKQLSRLPMMPKCQYLDCSYCSNLRDLPKLDFCQYLDCSFCLSLLELPVLPLCKILYCVNCIKLLVIPPLPSCETLDCSLNNITRIFELPVCKNLICNFNWNLMKLPLLPLCEFLSCRQCSRLSSLPLLSKCREIYCEGCVNLVKFPLLPECENLYCKGCIALSEFPFLPMCEILSYDQTESLDINTVPLRFRPLQDTEHIDTVQIDLFELSKYPLKTLFKLRDFIYQKRFMPKIQYIETDKRMASAIDGGGVSRNFVWRLMRSFMINSKKSDSLLFKKMDSGLAMPVIDPSRNLKVQIKAFQILGSLFDLCLWSEAVGVELTTGIVFDREFFQIIQSLSFDDLERVDIKLQKIPTDLTLKLIAQSSDGHLCKIGKLLLKPKDELNSDEFEVLRQTVRNQIDEEEVAEDFYPENFHKDNLSIEEFRDMADWMRDLVIKILITESEYKYLPAIIVANELKQRVGLKADYDQVLSFGVENLEAKIQGLLSSEAILNAIQPQNGVRNLDQELVERTIEFVRRWIREASIKDLMDLNSFITGSPTMQESTSLHLVLNNLNSESLPTSRSCFKQFNLTVNYPDFNVFKDKLETALQNVNNLKTSGFELV